MSLNPKSTGSALQGHPICMHCRVTGRSEWSLLVCARELITIALLLAPRRLRLRLERGWNSHCTWVIQLRKNIDDESEIRTRAREDQILSLAP